MAAAGVCRDTRPDVHTILAVVCPPIRSQPIPLSMASTASRRVDGTTCASAVTRSWWWMATAGPSLSVPAAAWARRTASRQSAARSAATYPGQSAASAYGLGRHPCRHSVRSSVRSVARKLFDRLPSSGCGGRTGKSTSLASGKCAVRLDSRASRSSRSGAGNAISRSKRPGRRTAGSSAFGRFVAASTCASSTTRGMQTF
jgi:hypothetical protein